MLPGYSVFLCIYCTSTMVDSNGVPKDASPDFIDFPPGDVIIRDVCILGGGSSGTYSAIRLRDFGKSVVVVEAKSRLGGHTETYKDPETGTTLDIGVIVFGHLAEVKNYFARFDIPLKTVPTSLGPPEYVDLATGKTVEHTTPDQGAVGAAMQKYAAEVLKYPGVQAGFNLTYPVPEDLLLPFGQFVEKYSLGALVPTVFAICQGYAPLLDISTIYVFKYFNLDLLNTLGKGFLTTERNNTSELYEKAAESLGADALLDTTLISMDRSRTTGPVRLLVRTPSGRKLILAKKIISTIPLLLSNLHAFDLSPVERTLFAQHSHSAFYTGVLRNTNLPTHAPIHALAPGKPYSIPDLPGIYTMHPNSASGLIQVYYGSPHALPEEEIRADIIAAVQRMQRARGIPNATMPEFATFANHTPFNIMVPNEPMRAGFYEELNKLQGERHTWYCGASFHTQDSSVLWRFIEELLPRVLRDLRVARVNGGGVEW